MARRVRLESLIGRRVLDANGRTVGHLEEIVARREGRELVVYEFRLGAYAWLHRFADGVIGRAVLGALPFTHPTLYRVPWKMMDLSDPLHPRVRCAREDLNPAA